VLFNRPFRTRNQRRWRFTCVCLLRHLSAFLYAELFCVFF
jgi:hypothetical protein